jgi:hypothetical protein
MGWIPSARFVTIDRGGHLFAEALAPYRSEG